MRHLRWLTLLGFLGLLGFFTDFPMFRVLFVFFAFVPLFGYDERKEAIFNRAAAIAFVVTTITLVSAFICIGLTTRNGVPPELLSQLGYMIAVVFIVHVLTFVLSYLYFELRGFPQ